MDTDTKSRPLKPTTKRSTWPPWVDAVLVDWRARWPEAFTKPVPLAAGITRQIKEALFADGISFEGKKMGMANYLWTAQGTYLRAMASGEMRRNLDGSEAGVPDDAARDQAQKMLDALVARRAEQERKRQEHNSASRHRREIVP